MPLPFSVSLCLCGSIVVKFGGVIMRYPIGFTLAQAKHRAKMTRLGRKRYPTVLMLEPLYTCNHACIGCSAERHTGKPKGRMTLAQSFQPADDGGTPIVNL